MFSKKYISKTPFKVYVKSGFIISLFALNFRSAFRLSPLYDGTVFKCATYWIVLAGIQVRSRTRARDNFLARRYTRYRQEPAHNGSSYRAPMPWIPRAERPIGARAIICPANNSASVPLRAIDIKCTPGTPRWRKRRTRVIEFWLVFSSPAAFATSRRRACDWRARKLK